MCGVGVMLWASDVGTRASKGDGGESVSGGGVRRNVEGALGAVYDWELRRGLSA